MKIFSRKHFIVSTVLASVMLISHSTLALLINSPTNLTGTENISVSFGNSSVGVGYIRRWTTTERICKRRWFKKKCTTTTHHHSANEIQSRSSRYTWDFGDGNSVTGVVLTGNSYYSDGNDQLLINLPTRTHSYLTPNVYNASLTMINSSGETDSRTAVVMVRPSSIVSSNTDVCDINNATVISARSFGLWRSLRATTNDIVFIKKGHTVMLPKGNTQLQVAGLCIEGTIKTYPNKISVSPNHVVITANAIHNRGTISTAAGVTGSIISNAYEHATAGGSISLFAGRFINEGEIDARGRGGDDIPYPYFTTASGRMDAWGGNGGHIGIFPNEFTNTGSLLAGNGGDAILFKDWANYVYGNAYGGRGGSVYVSAQNMGLSSSSGTLKAGCGGTAEAIGNAMKTIKMKGGNWFSSASFTGTFTEKLFDVAGGKGGDVNVNLSHLGGLTKGCNGRTANHVLVLPTEYIRLDPTLIEVDETTRLVNANHVYIYAGDDAEVDLRKLSPNAVQAYKTITLSVGENSVIDLRGISDTVFQAAERVEVYADEVLLDEGVTLEDLADAPEISVNPSKILHFVDLDYQSQAKGVPGSFFSVPVTVINSGPSRDTYNIRVQDSRGWLVPPYPTQISVNGLRRSELLINMQLPTSDRTHSELVVTVTSQSDPTVKTEAYIRVSVQYPEWVASRNGRQADVAVVLDAHYRMEDKLPDIADSLMKFLVSNGPISPSDSKVEEWLSQFDDNNPPTKEAYLEFIQQFQPHNPPPPPVIELITFTNSVMTRVVTDNLSDVIGRIRALQTSENDSCTLASVDAVEYAASNLKEHGHLFLAVASTPNKDMSAAIQQLQQKRIQAHVLLAGNCDGSTETALAYQTLSKKTGGVFRLTTEDEAGDLAVLEDLLDMIMSMGKYTVLGTIKNEAGNPIEGALIEINTKTTTTDAAGNWEIADFMEGKYALQTSKEGYVFAPQIVELGNEVYLHEVEIKPLSSLTLVAIPDTWDDIRQGEELTYTFNILNGGVQIATGVTLTDFLPIGTTAIALEALHGGSCDLETLICQLPDLNSGASATVELTLHNDGAENLRNVATLSSNEYPADIQKSYKVVKPHLSVALTDTPDPVVMENVLHYQVAVELSALAPETTATDVELFLRLPEGTELVNIATEYGVCDISEYPAVVCQLVDLSIATPDSVSHVVISVDVKLTDATLLILTHEARVAAANYSAHTVRERTNVVVPPEAMANITFVMDTTHSMNEEVNGVIKALQMFIEEQINANLQPIVSIIEFKDNVTLRAFTSNMQQVLDTVQQFQVAEGGLCQEASAEALGLAISHTVRSGTIFLITDAAPYEDADLGVLTKRLRDKQIRFSTLISGDCTTSSGQNSWK
jgi:uncharacterized repeat protein (TIGR01451 family)